MRVGIVTFHCSYNFGSALQAVALKRALEQIGHAVHVVDYRGEDFAKYRLFRGANPKKLVADTYLLRRNVRRRAAFEGFMDAHMALTTRFSPDNESALQDLQGEFDAFVAGSDQIWNLDCTHGPKAPYFLAFAGNRRRVAYAPSIAHVSFLPENFSPAQQEEVREWLGRFDALSVREASTVPLFQALTKRPISVCLDPTLLLEASQYKPFLAPLDSVASVSDTLFVYMLEQNDALVRRANEVAREMGTTITYVSRRPLRFEVPSANIYGIGPAEFLTVLANARAVMTNSFHATVFSTLFGRPFLTFGTKSSSSRMREFLATAGLEDHLTHGDSFQLPMAFDRQRAATALEPSRQRSLAFLENSLAE